MLAVHHSLRIIQDMEMRVALKIGSNAMLGMNVYKAVFGTDLVKLKQETKSIRSRALSKDLHFMILEERKVISWPVC